MNHAVRSAAVAGLFYSDTAVDLRQDIETCLSAGRQHCHPVRGIARAYIVPHAGHMFSGLTAGTAYAHIQDQLCNTDLSAERVVLIGPAHRLAVEGACLPATRSYQTPMGMLRADQAFIDQLDQLPFVSTNEAAHEQEHSLEVQFPFLQVVLPDVPVVPLLVGRTSPAEVASLVETALDSQGTILLISSDLSHFLPDAQARDIDQRTIDAICNLEPEALDSAAACGALPIAGLLMYARQRGLQPQVLHQCNSGDFNGDRRRVVGYASLAFVEYQSRTEAATDPDSRVLCGLARAAIASQLGISAPQIADRDTEHLPWLQQPGASFVSLQLGGQLRGCIGSIIAHRALREDIQHNARAAAFADPRFPALSRAEYPQISIEVSLLTPMESIECRTREELFAQLEPGIHGLLIEYGTHRGVFLPQVWEQLPEHRVFLRELLHKAGLDDTQDIAGLQASRFRIEKHPEHAP